MSAVFATSKQRSNAETNQEIETITNSEPEVHQNEFKNLKSFSSKGHGRETLRTLTFDIMLNLFA